MGEYELKVKLIPEWAKDMFADFKGSVGGGGKKEERPISDAIQNSGITDMLKSIGKATAIMALILTSLHEVARPVFFVLKILLRPLALAIFAVARLLGKNLKEITKKSTQELKDDPGAFLAKTLLGGLVGNLLGGPTGGLIGAAIGPMFGDIANEIGQSLGGALQELGAGLKDGGVGGQILGTTLEGVGSLIKSSGEGIKEIWDSMGTKIDTEVNPTLDDSKVKVDEFTNSVLRATTPMWALGEAVQDALEKINRKASEFSESRGLPRARVDVTDLANFVTNPAGSVISGVIRAFSSSRGG